MPKHMIGLAPGVMTIWSGSAATPRVAVKVSAIAARASGMPADWT